MNELNKLIEQYGESKNSPALAMSLKSIIQFESEKEGSFWLDFINFVLASRPTCGKEQRKFLDEVEKGEWYDTSDDDPEFITQGIMVGQETFLFRQDFKTDLQKVIKGE